MGVYIIKHKFSDWFKIGHHKITKTKLNVYFRFINRGFYACRCPDEIKNKVSFEDLDLLYWFPNLDIVKEIRIHNYLKKIYEHYGEWYINADIDIVVKIITNVFNGVIGTVTDDDLMKAKQWRDNLCKMRQINNLSELKINQNINSNNINSNHFIKYMF